jgi:hypothetical protein
VLQLWKSMVLTPGCKTSGRSSGSVSDKRRRERLVYMRVALAYLVSQCDCQSGTDITCVRCIVSSLCLIIDVKAR